MRQIAGGVFHKNAFRSSMGAVNRYPGLLRRRDGPIDDIGDVVSEVVPGAAFHVGLHPEVPAAAVILPYLIVNVSSGRAGIESQVVRS